MLLILFSLILNLLIYYHVNTNPIQIFIFLQNFILLMLILMLAFFPKAIILTYEIAHSQTNHFLILYFLILNFIIIIAIII